jgi:hypothetical protein
VRPDYGVQLAGDQRGQHQREHQATTHFNTGDDRLVRGAPASLAVLSARNVSLDYFDPPP